MTHAFHFYFRDDYNW